MIKLGVIVASVREGRVGVPIAEAVAIPNFPTLMDKDTGRFTGSEGLDKSAAGMLKELARWASALRTLRA